MKTKKCIKCKQIKFVSEFYKDKKSKYGVKGICKMCSYNYRNNRAKTKEGIITIIYNSQKRSSIDRHHQPPTYTREELSNWLLTHPDFDELYNDWVESDYDKWLKPSIDRLDDYKGYSFDNIRLTTWKINHDRWPIDARNGINNKNSKAVLQYDKNGNFIKEYYSAMQAERDTGVANSEISKVCKGAYGHKTAGCYMWKYK